MIIGLFALMLGAVSADSTVAVDTTAIDTSYVEYHDSPVFLPSILGFRVPSYNRVDGLIVPWGPRISTGFGKITADALVTYRSDIGDLDPSITGTIGPENIFLKFFAGRGTFTNDAWIRGEFVNSIATFGLGKDARNYYRADRYEGRLNYLVGNDTTGVLLHAGALTERAWSTGSPAFSNSYPYSLFGRTWTGIKRPNPSVIDDRISSANIGARLRLEREESKFEVLANSEIPWESPGDWVQYTIHATTTFPTFSDHHFEARIHSVVTTGDTPPPQRFAYLGAASTIETVDPLALGGDQLFFTEEMYVVPLHFFALPVFGEPKAAVRYAAGNAGIDKLPRLIQNVGVRLSFAIIDLDFIVNPDDSKTKLVANFSLPF